MKEAIERSDKVNIHFSSGESLFECLVLYSPCAEGDSWRIKDKDGDLHYIQKFEMMSLLPQGYNKSEKEIKKLQESNSKLADEVLRLGGKISGNN